MKFDLKKLHYTNGIQCRINFDNGCGISIISGSGAYCGNETFEIAPLFDDDLEEIDNWGDQVKGYVTPEEISTIVDYAETHSKEEYKEFLENFEFTNNHQTTLGELLKSIDQVL